MTERKTEERIAALEEARAHIETALSGNIRAGDPLYRSWQLLCKAIRDLRAEAARLRETGPGPAPDDLTRIRGINRDLARRLAERGIASYGQIAAWGPDEVRDVAGALELGRQVSRQNWIEQAALLDLRRPARTAEPAPPPEAALHPRARAAGHGVELHHILAHIRNEAALHRDPPATLDEHRDEAPDVAPAGATLTAHRSLAPDVPLPSRAGAEAIGQRRNTPGSQTAGPPLSEAEEATVTFVIRERDDARSADDGAEDHGAPSAAPLSEGEPAAGTWDALHGPSAVQAEEAEVVIVSRPADRRRRSAAPPSRP